MSAVHRAYDTVMGRDVALKRLLPVDETSLNESSSESLAREAAALARFQHPNIVTIFAFEEDAEGPFVVMELVEGEDLHSLMKSGALSWENFNHVAPQCLEPLVAAGDLNLLHRDIKPGNIMLVATPSGRSLVKLLDFGLAKFSPQPSPQTLDQQGSFLGSIDFIAPEQLELLPLDQRTDLYSLGCVFYYMLTLKSPFTGGNPGETAMNHIRHRCTPIGELRTDIPPLVADWLMRLISRYPSGRPDDAREALREFYQARKGLPFVHPRRAEDDDDDIPFASLAPVTPPEELPTDSLRSEPEPPASGAVGRVLKTPSGPILTTRTGSSPVRSSSGAGKLLSAQKSLRQLILPGTAPAEKRQTGRQLGVSPSEKKAGTDPFSDKGTWLVIGLLAAVVVVFVLLVVSVTSQ